MPDSFLCHYCSSEWIAKSGGVMTCPGCDADHVIARDGCVVEMIRTRRDKEEAALEEEVERLRGQLRQARELMKPHAIVASKTGRGDYIGMMRCSEALEIYNLLDPEAPHA